MGQRGAWQAGLLSVLLALAGGTAAAQEPSAQRNSTVEGEPRTAEEVLARMAEARKAIHSASYRMRKQRRYVQPVHMETHGPEGPVETDEVVVPAGTMAISEERFAVDGPKYRYEWEGPIPYKLDQPEGRGLGPSRDILAYDGKVRCRYDPISGGSGGASIWQDAMLDRRICKPLLDFHFGLRMPSGTDTLGEVRLAGKQEWQGRPCYVIVAEVGPWRLSYWIDPERDWTLVREMQEVVAPENNHIWDESVRGWRCWSLVEMDWGISYEQDPSGLWRPAGWALQWFDDYSPERALRTVDTVVVLKARLNIEMPPSTFTVDLPDGTHVFDRDRQVGYTWDSSLSPEQLEDLIQKKIAEEEERQRRGLERLEAEMIGVGEPAPDFEAEALDGSRLELSDFRGKVVLLDFWGMWCPPSLEDTSELKLLYDTFKDDGQFTILSLNLDRSKEVGRAKEYIEAEGLRWHQAFLGAWLKSPVPEAYGAPGVRSFFLVGPDGKILARGFSIKEIKRAVAEALGKK